jgi:hypothetical protein
VGGVGEEGAGDARAEKRSTRCGSEGKAGGGARRGRSSSMAWEVGSPSSAVNDPPPLPADAVAVDEEDGPVGAEAGIRAWISGPETGSSCSGGGEGWRIGAAALSGTRGVAVLIGSRGAEAGRCARAGSCQGRREGRRSEEGERGGWL